MGLVGDDLGCEVEGSPDKVAYKICPEVGKWDERLGVHVTGPVYEPGKYIHKTESQVIAEEKAGTVRKARKPYKHHGKESKCSTGDTREEPGA